MSLTTLRSKEFIPIAYFYAEREHEKDAFYKLTLSVLKTIFLATVLTSANKRYVAADGMSLKLCKRNWYNTYGLSEKKKEKFYCMRFFFVGYIFKQHDPYFLFDGRRRIL